MKAIKTAVIGFGNMGSAHASTLFDGKVEGLILAAVCDHDAERLELARSIYGDILYFENWREVMDCSEIDAVIVAVPHPLHADIAIAALKAQKHVMVEKPVDITCSKALKLNEAAKNAKTVFALMFNQRTNPLFQKARELVQSGALGELKRSVWIITNWYRTQGYYDSGSWRATWQGEGGGVLLNQAPHNLDLWQWICGMPVQITAFCDEGKYHRIEVEDDVTIFARYANGATGTFITTTGEYPGTNRLEISGTLGKIVLENKTLKYWKLPISERELCVSKSKMSVKEEPEFSEFSFEGKIPGHQGILQNFSNRILKGEPLISPGEEGINELMISNAAYLSSWKNAPVDLPFDPTEFDEFLLKKQNNSKPKKKGLPEMNRGYQTRWDTKW